MIFSLIGYVFKVRMIVSGHFIIGKNEKIVIIAALVCGAWQQADAQYVSKVWVPDQKDGTYINPIIHADYSDPDVCAAGDDFT